jgi:hypothetical protein
MLRNCADEMVTSAAGGRLSRFRSSPLRGASLAKQGDRHSPTQSKEEKCLQEKSL